MSKRHHCEEIEESQKKKAFTMSNSNGSNSNSNTAGGASAFIPGNRLVNTYGLSSRLLESMGISGTIVSKIFIANLDYFVDENMLTEVFQLAGNILNVEVLRQDGKSKGMAIIEYSHPFEAAQAMSMFNNQTYYERRISVRMDKDAEKEKVRAKEIKLPPGLVAVGPGFGEHGVPKTDLQDIPNTFILQTQLNPHHRNSSNDSDMHGMVSNIAMKTIADMVMGQVNDNSMKMNYPSPNMPMPNPPFNSNSMGMQNFSQFNQGNNGNSQMNMQYSAISVSNLPEECSWQKVRDLCKRFGEVKYSEVKGRGSAKVTFTSEMMARKAVEGLNRKPYEGKYLEVRMFK